jgi:hypothetical protein
MSDIKITKEEYEPDHNFFGRNKGHHIEGVNLKTGKTAKVWHPDKTEAVAELVNRLKNDN